MKVFLVLKGKDIFLGNMGDEKVRYHFDGVVVGWNERRKAFSVGLFLADQTRWRRFLEAMANLAKLTQEQREILTQYPLPSQADAFIELRPET